MLIAGMQKLTLLDYPGQVACTIFTGGCNFRCPFCHNASLVLPQRCETVMEEAAALDFLRKRQGLLDAVVVSGGEPLLQEGLEDFLRVARALGYRIKLDTNGSFPDRLRAVVEQGLVDRVAMDVKNAPALYAETAGVRMLDVAALERSKSFLLTGSVDYEFRTTVVRGLHTRESLLDAARWIKGAKEYYLQQYRDSGGVIAPGGLGAFSDEEMRALASAVRTVVPAAALRGVDEREKQI
ncbi:MAG: anaerobic ribonucleoside-triphosphate reductase activating protein [Ruminococcaceae bacterium]|jgi:pyruvate formate lyase activating enzyme|nr:anaerobic ribonucleoside-triphosphate reductase activating protein [Oscillospiraceae bacterium]